VRRYLSLILALAAKDVRVFLADRRAAALSFAVPIVLASAFGLIFHKTPGQSAAPQLPIVVVVESDGPFTKQVVADLLASPRIDAEVVSRAEAEARVGDRRPGVAVVFPADFESLATWTPHSTAAKPTIAVLTNPLSESEGQWAEGVVSEVVMKRIASDRLKPWTGQDAAPPFVVKTSTTVGEDHREFNSYTHSFSGMTIQYLLFWGMESGLCLLRDRRRSVWTRLQAAPVPVWAVLMGKALSTAGIAVVQVFATFAFGYVAFGVSIGGSWLGFLLLAIAAGVLAAATGLLVAAVGGTEARARSVAILVILAVSMIGGLWMPSFVLPGWARDTALALPTTWLMRGFDGVTWQGRGFGSILPNVGVAFAFAAVLLAAAVARLVTSEARRRRGFA